MAALGVDLRLGAAASAEAVLALEPDAVICATGSRPITPAVPGSDGPNVVQGWDVLEGRASTSDRVAVVSQEDHFETPNVAAFLAAKGKKVEIFHHWLGIGSEIDRYSIGMVMKQLEQGGVKIHTGHILAGVDGNALSFVSAFTGEQGTVRRFRFSRPCLRLRARYDALRHAARKGPVSLPRGFGMGATRHP